MNFVSPLAQAHVDEDHDVVHEPPQQLWRHWLLLEHSLLLPDPAPLPEFSLVELLGVLPVPLPVPLSSLPEVEPETAPELPELDGEGLVRFEHLNLLLESRSISPPTHFLHDPEVVHMPRRASGPVSPSAIQHSDAVPKLH